ncbi:MAG TPA: hypothetical protein VD997_13890 [Phycisphaerales bacterium]|nr:hypothetical protein [Phycisphaerales bacterium]
MRGFRVVLLTLVCGAMVGVGGCGALGLSGRSEPREFRMGPAKMSPAEVQAELMAYVDTFQGTMSQSYSTAVQGVQDAVTAGGVGNWKPTQDDVARARRSSVESRIAIMSSLMNIAASPNPYVGVADLVTAITLTRMVMEEPQAARTWGAEGQKRLIEALKQHEERAWRIAAKVYTEEQVQELRTLIHEWRKSNPEARWVAGVRLEDFAKDRLNSMTSSNKGTSVLSLLGIDPLAGLDPAAREVEKSRMLAERMFYYASRSPNLIKLQSESLLNNVVRNAEVKDTIDSIERISKAAENLSLEAAALPANLEKEREETLKQAFEQIRAERQATIDQIFAGLTEQRQAVISDLDQQQGGLQTTAKEIRTTIESAKETIDSAKELTGSVQEILQEARSFSTTVVPTPTGGVPTLNVADKADRDVLKDYAVAVDKTGATLDQLVTLTGRLENLIASPQIEKQVETVQEGVERVQAGTKDVIDHAFWKLLILSVVAPVVVGATVVVVRRLQPVKA